MNRFGLKIFQLCLFLIGFFFLMGCSRSDEVALETGDLLFRGKTPSMLSQAIDDVTQTGDDNHFSHIGLVEVIKGEVNVIHADGLHGVCLQPLDSFLLDGEGNSLYVEAFRLKPGFGDAVDMAIRRARSAIGEPYNYSYIIGDTGYYCSELIWWAFNPDSVFTLEPMTFKDQNTGTFHPGWVEHYEELSIEIPEGRPGCNPNGMAASDNIYRLGVVN